VYSLHGSRQARAHTAVMGVNGFLQCFSYLLTEVGEIWIRMSNRNTVKLVLV